jgi:hypothetical protein
MGANGKQFRKRGRVNTDDHSEDDEEIRWGNYSTEGFCRVQAFSSLFVMMLCNFVELVLMVPMAMAVFVTGLKSCFNGCTEVFL